MLTEEELRALLADVESDRVERTVAFEKGDKFAEAVCAFANDLPNHRAPGYLIVGARDDGRVAGVEISDKLLQTLAALRDQGQILPPPALAVEKVELAEGAVAVVTVQPSDIPPVRYKGRICVRVGPRRGYATEQEERILSERRAALVATYDVRPVPGSSTADLTLRLFDDYRAKALPADVIEANHRTTDEALAALRFFDLRRGEVTVAGVLTFGSNPRYFLPGAYVQFLKFPGTALSDTPDDQLEVSGDIASVIRVLHDKMKSYNRTRMEPGEGLKDRLLHDYPEWALRELVHNAVIHRDYASTTPIRVYWFDDRIEIQNPGGLHGHLTPALIRVTNSYRNPVLAEACKVLGYVNKFGHGIARADKLLEDNGNPPLEIIAEAAFFQVTVRRRVP